MGYKVTTIKTDYTDEKARIEQLRKLKQFVPVLVKEGEKSESLLMKVNQAIKIMEAQDD